MSQGGTGKPESGGKPQSQQPRPAQSGKPGAAGAKPASQKPAGPGASGARPAPQSGQPASSPKVNTQQQVQIGSYRVLERVGAGGMGTVYRAMHVELEREVALKVMSKEMNANATMVARFKREAKAAAVLQHENIVQIYDVGEDKERGIHYLALEFVRGRDLADLIEKKKILPVKEAIEYLKQSAQALQCAFDKGIVHRDIKPSNFLITTEGKVKLCDMGLALRTEAGEESKVTRDGTTVGTVDYMSPEQARDSRLADTRSDIYSLGCTMYQMLTGRVPYEEGSIPEKLFKHAQEPAPDPLQFNPDIPTGVLYVMNKMLEKKPEDRYQSPKELVEDLENLLKEFNETTKPQDAALKTLAIGAEADDTASEELMLKRPTSMAVKKRQEEEAQQKAKQQQQKMMIVGGAAAAVLVIVTLVGWLVFRKPSKTPEVVTGPSVNTPSGGSKDTAGQNKVPPPNIGTKTPPISDSGTKKGSDTVGNMPDTKGPEVKGKTDDGENTSKVDSTASTKQATPEVTPPPPPRVSDEERKKLIQELFPPPRTTVPIPGTPVALLRGMQSGVGIFASLEAACKAALTDAAKSKKIQIEDNGPLFERAFSITNANLEIRPKPPERQQAPIRPIVVIEAAADKGKTYFFQTKNTHLVIEGIDFIVDADVLRDSIGLNPYALFDIQGGDLTLKNCTFTIRGKHASSVSLVRFHGSREKEPPQLTIENCLARGEPLSVVSLQAARADVKLIESLFVGGQMGTMFELLPPTEPAHPPNRTIGFRRCTCVTRGDFMIMDGKSSGDVPTKLILLDSIIACSTPGSARKLMNLKSWPDQSGAMSKATLDARSTLYTGWESLIFSGAAGNLTAKTAEQWLQAWKQEANDSQVRRDAWPTEELGELSAVASLSFDPVAIGAGIPGKLGLPIGCAIDQLPSVSPLLLERSLGQIDPPPLLSDDKILPSFTYNPQKNPLFGQWQGEQNRRRADLQQGPLKPGDHLDPVLELTFNANTDGDLGKFLMAQENLPDTTIVIVSGAGTHPMSPVRLAGKKSLVLGFVQNAGQPLIIQPAAGTEAADAMIDVRDGDLIIDGAIFNWPANAPAGTPKRFLKVERGNLTVGNSRLTGPLQGDTGFEAISFAGGPQKSKWPEKTALAIAQNPGQPGAAPLHLDFHPAPHERANVCQLINCYVGAETKCFSIASSQAILRLENCVAITPGTLASFDELDYGVPQNFEVAVVLNQNTLVASKAFFEVGAWIAPTLPPRPFVFTSRDNLYFDPFEPPGGGAAPRTRSNVLLRYGGRTLQQGILHWESDYDAFSNDIVAFVTTKEATGNPTRQDFGKDWVPVWGRPHIKDYVSEERRNDKVRLKAGAAQIKLKDFERDKKLSVLELQPQCDAAKKSSAGGPIGADLKRLAM